MTSFARPLILAAAAASVLLSGCAIVTVAGAVTGAAISVTGAVVSTGVKVTGKVIEAAIPGGDDAPKKD